MNDCLQSHKTPDGRVRNPLSLAVGICGLLLWLQRPQGSPGWVGVLGPLSLATKGNGKCVLQVSIAVLTVLAFGSVGLQLTAEDVLAGGWEGGCEQEESKSCAGEELLGVRSGLLVFQTSCSF